jgi:MoxR-like ATPase
VTENEIDTPASDQAQSIPPEINCDETVELVVRPGLPEQYHQFEERTALALRAALAACRPLLVRGEPGVGKTQLAAAAAKVFGRPLVQKVVEARTESRDLLWEYDAVMRLAEAQIAGARGSMEIARSDGDAALGPRGDADQSRIERMRADLDIGRFVRPGLLWWAFDWEDAARQAGISRSPQPKLPDWAKPSNGCVVLIDEIDKADTDVPNGLLEALGAGEFTPLGRDKPVQVRGEFPLVIITTNEERALPSAFVRRCLVLHLELPKGNDTLVEFLVGRAKVHFPQVASNDKSVELFRRVANLVVEDRREAEERSISPLPGQAEYLDLIRTLLKLAPESPEEQWLLLDDVKGFALRKNAEPGS